MGPRQSAGTASIARLTVTLVRRCRCRVTCGEPRVRVSSSRSSSCCCKRRPRENQGPRNGRGGAEKKKRDGKTRQMQERRLHCLCTLSLPSSHPSIPDPMSRPLRPTVFSSLTTTVVVVSSSSSSVPLPFCALLLLFCAILRLWYVIYDVVCLRLLVRSPPFSFFISLPSLLLLSWDSTSSSGFRP